ncbi:MAG TPA: ABC transporter permease [Longimicrobiales bacterium]
MKRLEWYIARRYLASRRQGRFLSLITLIAVGGITLGVTALITVIAVMTGLQRDLQAKILGSNPHVYVFEQGGGFRLGRWSQVLEQVRGVPGVAGAEPFILTQVAVLPAETEYAQFGTLYGIDTNSDGPPLTQIQEKLRSGEYALGPTQSGLPGVLVGSGLAAKLGILPGDVIRTVSPENIRTGPLGELVPVIRQFEVTGTFTTGMYEYDNQNLYTDLASAQDLLGLPADTVSGIAVNVTDAWEAAEISEQLGALLGFPYWTQDWMSLNANLFSALKLEKLAMGVILSLIIVVAAFNIISTLIMVVTNKTREIGILKSIGMTDRRVLRIFILQGLAIGVIGTVLGTAGGLTLVWLLDRYRFITLPGDVYMVDTLPVALDPLDLVLILALSILIAFAATLYPARQASRLYPVEAIRHE